LLARVPGAGVLDAVPRTVTFLAGSELRRLTPWRNGRPVALPSPQYAAQVALDEVMLGALAASRAPRASEYKRLGAEVMEAYDVWQQHGWIDDPASYHRAPPRLVDVRVSSRRSRGVAFQHVSFPSEYRPGDDEPGAARWRARAADRTAHAWVLRHEDGPRPWLVCIHGMGMGVPIADLSAFEAGRLYRDGGFNLVLPVLPAHGPRRAHGLRLPDVPGADYLDLIHMLAQGLWDVRRLLGWIRDEGATAIGVHGISLGGYVAALLACHEPGLAGVIAGVPVVDFERLQRHHASPSQLRRAARHHLVGDEARGISRVVSPLALPSAVPRERLAVYGGLGDRVATAAQAQLLVEHWDPSSVCWYAGGHVGFMWSRRVTRFVQDRLDAMAS
jgi:hypothetical protein